MFRIIRAPAKFVQNPQSVVQVVSGMINVSAMPPKTAALPAFQESAELHPSAVLPAPPKLNVRELKMVVPSVSREPAPTTIKTCVNATV